MRGLIDFFARLGLTRCERGATAVEYGLILAMVVLAMKTTGMWGNVANEVTAH